MFGIVEYKLFFEFIRYAMNPTNQSIPDMRGMDWHGFYRFACEQAIAGVVFDTIKELKDLRIEKTLLLEWLATTEQIAWRNRKMNHECSRLTRLFELQGHKTSILKGQANARLYPNPLCRQSGDIDIYVDGGEDNVLETLHNIGLIDKTNIGQYEGEDNASKSYHHVHLPTNENGIDVEIHFRPSSGVWNPFANKRLQKFLKNEIKADCVMVEDGFWVPSLKFALVMQMAHIQKHYMDEGVGFRQVIDYFYLLKTSRNEDTDNRCVDELLGNFGLRKMAGALMWVLKEILGLDENLLITSTDERRGKMLLRDILHGGNFGHYAEEKKQNGLRRLFWGRIRHIRLMYFDFGEAFWFELHYWKMQSFKTFIRIQRRNWTIR